MGVLRHVSYGDQALGFTNLTHIRMHSPRIPVSIHKFLCKSHLTPTLNILIKLKLRVVITIDEGHGLNPSRPNLGRREKFK